MNHPVIIIGAGGHAKVLIETLRLCSVQMLGITDSDPERTGTEVLDVRVIGNDTVIEGYSAGSVLLVNGLGSIDIPKRRKDVFEAFKVRGFTFATIIHPTAVVASDVVLGEGAQVMAGAVIQPGSRIGMNTIINTNATVDHDCRIGDHVHLAPGVVLSGAVRIDDVSHLGTGAVVIQGVTVGPHTLVGAGSVVVRDVSGNTAVVGVPAKAVQQ
jgi:sugar O-acyltransferase (sialic acid O-acetyltransferase NeuD family)